MTSPQVWHALVKTVLEEAEAVEAAGTPGPWRRWADGNVGAPNTHLGGISTPTVNSDPARRLSDADLVVVARNAYPRALALVRRLTTEHRPIPLGDRAIDLEPDRLELVCDICPGAWPCSTYRAAAAVLGVPLTDDVEAT